MAPKKNYTREQMNAALEAVARGTPVAQAARIHSIPRVTLMYKSQGKLPVDCRMGPNTILTTNEEDLLEKWILSMAKAHHPVNKEQLLESVQLIIRESKRPNPFTDARPGRKWYDSFMKRHPILSARVAQNLTPAREKVSEQQLREWFQEIDSYLKSKNLFEITNDPTRVFNSDESAFFLQPKADKVLARKGDKSVYNAGTNDEKENLTVLVTANAAGEFAPPMIIFKYERIPSNIALSINKSWGLGRSESGWMCGATFFEYVTNVFVPWLESQKIKRPILMFIDGHVSHMTLHLSQYCSRNGIELFSLYPNSTHLTQPMDVAVFKPLKQFWKSNVRDWHLDNHGIKFRKDNFGSVFEKALSKITKETIQNGFRSCGICPFNVENVKFSKISTQSANIKQVPKAKEGLLVLEKFIPSAKLKTFRANFKADWTGNIEDTSLFSVWSAMKLESTSIMEVDKGVKPGNESILGENGDEDTIAEYAATNNLNGESLQQEDINISKPGCSGLHLAKEKPIVDPYDTLATPEKQVMPAILSTTNTLSSKSITPLNVSSLKVQVPTPFKKALFWPEKTESEKKRKKEKIPSAITSEKWQEYHKKKAIEKDKMLEEKKRKAEERKRKKEEKAMQIQQKATKKKVLLSDTSDSAEEWVESGDSLDDVSICSEREEEDEDDHIPLIHMKPRETSRLTTNLQYDDLHVGDFILAKFLGRKKKIFFYKYVCVIQQRYIEDEFEVVSLRSINGKSCFKLAENDISTIRLEDIIEKLPQPEIQNVGDRLKYVFSNDIDICEA